MNIGSVFNQINSILSNQSNSQGLDSSLSIELQKGMDLLLSQGNNSVIMGKILGVEENSLLLSIGEGKSIKANVEANVNAKIGDTMTFQVTKLTENKVTLSPLFENSNQSLNVSSALKAASLPDTPLMQYMVKSMMEEGLSIDKQSLLDMNKAVMANPAADAKNLATMVRLNIPLENDMINQFENYKNYEHEIGKALADISDALTDSFETILLSENEIPKALDFLKDNIDILLFEDNSNNAFENSEIDIIQADYDFGEENEDGKIALVNDQAKDGDLKSANIDSEYKLTELKLSSNESDMIASNDVEGEKDSREEIVNDRSVINERLIDYNRTDNNVENKREFLGGINKLLNDGEIDIENTDLPKSTDSSEKIVKDIVKLFEKLSKEDNTKDNELVKKDIGKLLSSESFKNLLKDAIREKYSLKPLELTKEGKVSELYEKLNSQIKNLSNNITLSGHDNTPLGQAVNNLNSNVEFMNELNQTFNYIQLPLKLDRQNANGELYVYTNKKSLSKEDGSVSALLHLDMDNLGPIDIRVELKDKSNVKTKFFVNDDITLDLIADNIDILNERLNKRGYNMSADFINNSDEENKSVFDTILGESKDKFLISSKGFDARA